MRSLPDELIRGDSAVRWHVFAVRHEGHRPVEETRAELANGAELRLGTARIRVDVRTSCTGSGGVEFHLAFLGVEGGAENVSLGLGVEFLRWSRDEWVFMPACVYAGNRFPLATPEHRNDPRPDPFTWVTITRCPHLEYGPGSSRIQVLAGDCATPCVGVFSPSAGRAWLWFTDQATAWGDTGLHVEENNERTAALIRLKFPGVRERKYNWDGPLADRGGLLRAGDRLDARVIAHWYPATSPEDLYARFVRARKEVGHRRERHDLPFETAYRMVEEKHNRENWVEEYGYWSVGMRESPPQDWQTGWVGGPNTAWPLWVRGDAVSRSRALRVWDFIAREAVTPSGFVKGCFHKGQWRAFDAERCYLRYSADTLYFTMKMLLQLRVGPPHIEPKPEWLALARGLADAFVRCWERAGHFPHYADAKTGEVVLGGSCAAALAPAGLALASRYFDAPRYREIAEAAARRYRDHFLAKGLTNGGPGDIFQNVDSESGFALMESFAVLMEESGGAEEWVEAARRCAAYCSTWVTSYDFRFPPESTFAKLDLLTNGTVWANVQNKHAAPGICTMSGVSLLKLWRATGEELWLDLIRDIAHAIPQYISRADRPITDRRAGLRWRVMPPGWINERVNLSDWELRGSPATDIGVGEIFGGSTWCEPALLNTVAEIPGLYLDLDTLNLTILDHVYAQVTHADSRQVILRVSNPTAFTAAPVLLAESAVERAGRPLGAQPLSGLPAPWVPPFSTVEFRIPRDAPVRTSAV